MSIDVYTSIQTNYLSWIVILLSVSIISYPYISAGFITFFSLMLFAYVVHKGSHDSRNIFTIFTILHKYHHEHNNFFSHFSQIVLELLLGMTVIPLYYFLGENFINLWTGILFTLFYSTVHNINYGQLRVNDVHYLHHVESSTNIGPDICDIAFYTKNPKNTEVENTSHYIPNVIIISILVLFIKYLSKNDGIKQWLIYGFVIFSILCTLLVSVSSIYLYFTYCPPSSKGNVLPESTTLNKVEPNVSLEKANAVFDGKK